MRIASLFLTLALACSAHPADAVATTEPAVDPELRSVLVVAFHELDPAATLVARADTPAAVRAAAASLRRVVDESGVATAEETLPRGFVRLTEARVDDGTATVRLTVGPIARPRAGQASLDCGRTLGFRLERGSDGRWAIASRSVALC